MNTSDLQGKDLAGLRSDLETLRKEQFGLRMDKGAGQLAQTHRVREIRRDIARVKTVINQKIASGEAS